MSSIQYTLCERRDQLTLRLPPNQQYRSLAAQLVEILERAQANTDAVSLELFSWSFSCLDELSDIGDNERCLQILSAKVDALFNILRDPITGGLFQSPVLCAGRVWSQQVLDAYDNALKSQNKPLTSPYDTQPLLDRASHRFVEEMSQFAMSLISVDAHAKVKNESSFDLQQQNPQLVELYIKTRAQAARNIELAKASLERKEELAKIGEGKQSVEIEFFRKKLDEFVSDFNAKIEAQKMEDEAQLTLLRAEMSHLKNKLEEAQNGNESHSKQIYELEVREKQLLDRINSIKPSGSSCTIL